MGRQEVPQTHSRPQHHQEFCGTYAPAQRNEVVSEEEIEEQLHNAALNAILQTYDQVFAPRDQVPRSWAEQAEDKEDNETVSYVSVTPSHEENYFDHDLHSKEALESVHASAGGHSKQELLPALEGNSGNERAGLQTVESVSPLTQYSHAAYCV